VNRASRRSCHATMRRLMALSLQRLVSRLKALGKRLLPPHVRLTVTNAFYILRALFYLGSRYACPCCRGRFRRFLPVEPGAVGTLCPRCGSFARQRLLWLFLHQKTSLFTAPHTVLDVAPERILSRTLRSLDGIRYVSGDLDSPMAMLSLDVTDIPFRDDYFDVVFCHHVLEHVPDDRTALRELHRVLNREGFAILQTPFDPARAHTYEDASIVSPMDRLRAFGHLEHVRIYGRDLENRMREAGFTVRRDPFVRTLSPAVIDRYGLDAAEDIFVCKKGWK